MVGFKIYFKNIPKLVAKVILQYQKKNPDCMVICNNTSIPSSPKISFPHNKS